MLLRHVAVAATVMVRCGKLVEEGRDVIILSININSSVRTLIKLKIRISGGESASTWQSSCEFLTPVHRHNISLRVRAPVVGVVPGPGRSLVSTTS